MKCPIDGADLVMTDRQGIEIDYCPKCRGVWLDRGELDKIIERSAGLSAPQAPPPVQSAPPPQTPYRRDDDYRRDSGYRYDDDDYKQKKRKSLLGELFDF